MREMWMSEVNVPKLRFGEFEGEWVERRLDEISKVNPKSEDLPIEFIYIDLESVEKGLLVKSNKILKENAPSRAKRLLVSNDILFQTVRPYQKNNYFFQLNGDYVASTGYAQIRTKESSKFLYQKLHTDKFVNNVLLRCTGTSYPAINSTDLSKIKIFSPLLAEQQKIAKFLTSTDQKIEQLNQKRTLLESYKKGLMQKIFSQEIRFKRDDGGEFEDWVEKRLGEVSECLDSLRKPLNSIERQKKKG
jgi:type I restriction enzyme S subunit